MIHSGLPHNPTTHGAGMVNVLCFGAALGACRACLLPCPSPCLMTRNPHVCQRPCPSFATQAYGKMFHSGLPHKSINPIELAMAALQRMQVGVY